MYFIMKPRSVKIGIIVAAVVLIVSLYLGAQKNKKTEGLTASAPTSSGESSVKVLAASSWCGWSKKQVKEMPSIKSALQDNGISVELIEDNTPEGEKKMKELAEKHDVNGFPATLVVGSDGEVKGKISGYKPVDAMVAEVKKMI